MSKRLLGIAASPGLAFGKIYVLREQEISVEQKQIEDVEMELIRFNRAIEASKEELIQIKSNAGQNIGPEQASIFEAHLLLLEDPAWLNQVKQRVSEERENIEYAVEVVFSELIKLFEQMDNEYMRERAADIKDIRQRVMSHLSGTSKLRLNELNEEVIIVAHDLTPSDTAQLDKNMVKAFVTNIGGKTSHSAILARSLGIPAVVGLSRITEEVEHGQWISVDGVKGEVIVQPTETEIAEYQEKLERLHLELEQRKHLVHQPTRTKDGYQVELVANIGSPSDVIRALENGAEGIGLFRTEFLYMHGEDWPTEEEQFAAYVAVLQRMGSKPVVIRTLDIGGDKGLPYVQVTKELNPFLGLRAIRFCLAQQDIFRTQLRALLRASRFGNLKIMFPMVATVEEFRQAKALLEDEKSKLIQQGIQIADSLEIGIMVEIPSTAILANQFAKEVDFFSIGSNDLIQYTLAADRMNEQVAYLYQPYHPAVLRLIAQVIQAAHRMGKRVGMCGEMAGESVAIPILLGLGLDEFSMSSSSILPTRQLIAKLNKVELSSMIEQVLSFETASQVHDFLLNCLGKDNG